MPDARTSASSSSAGCILLAEDDAEMRTLLAAVLSADGHTVHQVADGREFVEWLARRFDAGSLEDSCQLVIADIQMPGYSGLDVLSSLHCLDSGLPVVVITAFGDEPTHRMARSLGAAAFFHKPFDVDALRTTVQRLLAERNAARR